MWIAEPAPAGRDDEIAEQGQRRTQPEGPALHRGDQRFVEVEYPVHEAARARNGDSRSLAGVRHDMFQHVLDVAAG